MKLAALEWMTLEAAVISIFWLNGGRVINQSFLLVGAQAGGGGPVGAVVDIAHGAADEVEACGLGADDVGGGRAALLGAHAGLEEEERRTVLLGALQLGRRAAGRVVGRAVVEEAGDLGGDVRESVLGEGAALDVRAGKKEYMQLLILTYFPKDSSSVRKRSLIYGSISNIKGCIDVCTFNRVLSRLSHSRLF